MSSHHPNPDLSPEGVEELPEIIGICPVHRDEFYVPHGGICPACPEQMAEYVPASTLQAERQLRQEHEAEIDRLTRERNTDATDD